MRGRGTGRGRHGVASPRNYWSNVPELEEYIFDNSTPENAEKVIRHLEEVAKYCGRKLDHGTDIQQAIMNEELLQIPQPPEADPLFTDMERLKWEGKVKAVAKQEQSLEENCKRAFAIIISQCSPYMEAKLRTLPGWNQIESDRDLIALVQGLKALCFE